MKPKVLIFIDWFLPGYKAGGPVTSNANMVNHLCNDFNFYIVTRNNDYSENVPYKTIIPNQWVKSFNATIMYLSPDAANKKSFQKIVSEQKFDFIFINGIYSLKFSILPLWLCKKNNLNAIVSVRGMLAPTAIDIKGGKKKLFLRIAKSIGLYKNITFHATNEQEKNDIKKTIGEHATVKIAPNLFEDKAIQSLQNRVKNPGYIRLVNIARIAPEKNLHYALGCLKNLKVKIDFDIYGPVYNEEYYNRCLAIVKSLPNNINVQFKGSVEPENISKTLNEYHLFFMPTLGENFGHVILQSLSAGTPVLISDKTPWQNLKQRNVGADFSLINSKSFETYIEDVCAMNQPKYNELSKAAYDLAIQFTSNKDLILQNKALFTK